MKKRLDILITERGFAKSREKAKAIIMSGTVYVDGQKEDKPGTSFEEDVEIEVKGKQLRYVSRGGLKLEKAIDVFKIDLGGKKCIDAGASTGGFTDCMLQNGAEHVISIDVGYGQFDWGLRNDERVTVMEKTNIRYLKREDIEYSADFLAADLSFISLKKVLPAMKELISEEGEMVLLIKPQFEAGREKVGKHGVVRDPEVHLEVINSIIEFCKEENMHPIGLAVSPIKGPEGNIEFLLHCSKQPGEFVDYEDILCDKQ